MKSRNQLGLFAKFWQPGKVKTRLAATIGSQLASEIYREFLAHLLSQLQNAADVRAVVFSPPENRGDFARLCGDPWCLQEQIGGDLGGRLKNFFSRQVGGMVCKGNDAGERKVVVVGSDCPLIEKNSIEDAFDRLDQHPAVLGPSKDGGYYLIGLCGICPNIFEGVQWSSDRVLEQTLQRLHDQQIGVSLLDEMDDVDTWADLECLMVQLEQVVRVRPHDSGVHCC